MANTLSILQIIGTLIGGVNPQDCPKDYWGENCAKPCEIHCNSVFGCDKTSGTCKQYCDSGYWGSYCNQHCPVNCIGGCNMADGFVTLVYMKNTSKAIAMFPAVTSGQIAKHVASLLRAVVEHVKMDTGMQLVIITVRLAVMNVIKIMGHAFGAFLSYGAVAVQTLVLVNIVLTVVYLMDYVKNVTKVTGANRVKTNVIWPDVNTLSVTKIMETALSASLIIGETPVIILVKLKTVNVSQLRAQNQQEAHAMNATAVNGVRCASTLVQKLVLGNARKMMETVLNVHLVNGVGHVRINVLATAVGHVR